MAFQSYDELINMASTNAKKASQYVQAAQKSNRPVVSADNPGYGENPRAAALKRSMKRKMVVPPQEQDDNITARKTNNY